MPPKKGQGRSRGRGRAQATAKSLPQKRSQQAPSRGQTQSGKKKKKKVEGLVDDDELVQRLMDLDNSSTLRKQRPRDDQGNLLPFDYRYLTLKPDHENRPFWVRGDGLIHLEAFSPLYEQARDFLVAICEPVSRPQFVHEYKLDKNALFAAASMGLTADLILKALNKLSKTPVEASVEDFVRTCTAGYGKVKLVLERGRYYIESGYPSVLRFLTKHPVIAKARVKRTEEELQEEAERIQRTGEAGVEAAYTSEGFLVRKKQQEKEESIGLKGVIDIDSKNADNGETRTTAENKEQEDALLGRITGEVNSDEEEDVEEEDETANNDNEENNVPQNGKEKNSKLKSIPETERRQDRRIFSQFGSHRDDTRITHTETFTELGRRLIRALVGIERCNVVLDSSRFGLNNDLSDSSSTQTGNHGRCSLQSALEQTCAKVVANHSAWLDTKRRTSSKDTFLHQGLECYKRSNKISDRRNRVHKQKLAKLEWEQNHGPMPDDDEEARISRHQRQLRHREEYIDTDWATKQAETNDAGESSLATSSGNNTAPSQKENKTGAMSDSDSEFDLEEDDNDDDECDELGAQHVDEEEEEDMKELTNEAKKFGEYEKQRQLQKKKFIVDDEDEEVDLKPLKSIGVELSFTDDASRQEYLRAREEARREVEEGSRDLSSQVLRFEIDPELVDSVKRACIIMDPPYPLMHEYDFKKDIFSPSLDIELRRPEGLRPYQSKSLAKMFGNSRARSGLIVLPCGAGKTLVGIAAVSTLKKNALVLCPNVTAVDQWVEQFQLFSTINAAYLIRLTSKSKTSLPPPDQACIVFTTYSMIGGDAERRATVTNELLRQIGERDWGLMILDETHQVVAKTFRRVLRIRAHCRVGLTATLVREDGAQRDLSHLIGPKLYEANWMDLTRAGYLANVEVCEVWCPMAKEFYKEYLRNRDAMTRRVSLIDFFNALFLSLVKRFVVCVCLHQVLATMNPIKCYTLHRLLEIHKQRRMWTSLTYVALV